MGVDAVRRRKLFLTAVREAAASAQAQRAWRTRVRKDARKERVRVRRLRNRALMSREALLVSRWRVWSLGLLGEPPTTLPTAWSAPPDAETAVRQAACECREVAAQAAGRAPVARALCEVTDERLRRGDEEADLTLGLTARMLDLAERELDGDDVETVLLASACRRCAEACRRALVALLAERG